MHPQKAPSTAVNSKLKYESARTPRGNAQKTHTTVDSKPVPETSAAQFLPEWAVSDPSVKHTSINDLSVDDSSVNDPSVNDPSVNISCP